MPKKIIVSVTNDLSTDQRVDKTCRFLSEMGYEVLLLGRKRPQSLPLDRAYRTHRMALLFNTGPLFYAEYNLRAFFFLLVRRCDLVLANDLDSLLCNYIASKLKGLQLVYDSHEYFTEVPELEGRWAKKAWSKIEAWIFPKLKKVYTVNRSIAEIYSKKYNVEVGVVHNFPELLDLKKTATRKDLDLPQHRKILILQGAGLNVDRGGEEAIETMCHLGSEFLLLIIGGGDRIEAMKDLVQRLCLDSKVIFRDRMPYQDMMGYTGLADLGLNLDKGNNANYRYSLPNKMADYIAAGIPVLSSDLVETGRFVREHDVGMTVADVQPEAIARAVEQCFEDENRYARWKKNTEKAAQRCNWENEKNQLRKIFDFNG